ncbi:alpha/beta fold hydrolase [Mycobacterium sp. MMS18-G62]
MRRFLRVGVWSLVAMLVVVTAVNLTAAKLPAMPPADGTYISLHGKEIHYSDQPGQGVPVVMIHGLPGTHLDFEPVVRQLQGRRVIAIDRPGYGWSKGGWLPFQEQIDAVHELLTRLKVSPAIVVGHSFGGAVALGLARRYPHDVANMVLVAPAAGGLQSKAPDRLQAHYIEFSQLPVIKTLIDVTAGNLIKRVSAIPAAGHAFEPAPVNPAYKQRLLSVTMTPGNLAAYASDELQFDDTMRWVDDNVPEIHVPSVIVGALGDQLVAIDHARRLADKLPQTRLITVDGNHMIPYTHPDVIAAEIRSAG